MTVTRSPWKWGNDPLPEQYRLGSLLREVTTLMMVQENEGPALTEALAALETAKAALTRTAPTDLTPRVGKHVDGPGRVYLDHCTDIPAWNPVFPAYTIEVVDETRATGTVNFPLCYEGSAGCVNGGVLGVFFDAVVQHHNCAVAASGATRDLNIRYRRFTPVGVDLDFEILRTPEERSFHSEVSVLLDGELLCSASTRAAVFVSGPNTPPVSPRRSS